MTADGLSGRDIICVGFADWKTELWTNQHHLMSRLSRDNRVLFVESLGLRQPQLAARDLRRMARRLIAGLTPPRAHDGVLVLSPLVIPSHGRPAVRRVNETLLRARVGRAARRLGFERPVLWAYVPHAHALLDVLRPSFVVYHCVDDIAAQKGVDGVSFRALEASFARRADLVLASAPALAARMRTLADTVVYAPNVADTSLFSQALEDGPVDAMMAALPRPRIVFTGAVVATKLDLELVIALSRRRRDWSIALVGPVGLGDPSTDVSSLDAEPNVHLLGARTYRELPAVLRGADAAIIPYAVNELTRSIFPMKVYEYLGAGLPVVATPLPSLASVSDVRFGADAGEFAAALEDELRNDGVASRRRRSAAAAQHSWDTRLAEISSAVHGLGG